MTDQITAQESMDHSPEMFAYAYAEITPEMMARAFWNMASDDQALFFEKLAEVIEADHQGGNTKAYSLGELQWFYVGDDLLKPENKLAKDMLMTMAAPLYLHTLRVSGA